MIEKNIVVESSYVDRDLKMKLPSAFVCFQDIALEDSDKHDASFQKTIDSGKLWVFTRIEGTIERYPRFLEELKEITYPHETKSFAFPRQFRILDKEGNTIIRFSSLWAIIDAKTRHLNFKPGLPEPVAVHMEGDLPLPGKTTPKEARPVYTRIIRHGDIDLNGHLNNVRYIETILDVFPSDYFDHHEVSHFLINFIKEVHEGEELTLYKSEDGTFVKGEASGNLAFEANLQWREI